MYFCQGQISENGSPRFDSVRASGSWPKAMGLWPRSEGQRPRPKAVKGMCSESWVCRIPLVVAISSDAILLLLEILHADPLLASLMGLC